MYIYSGFGDDILNIVHFIDCFQCFFECISIHLSVIEYIPDSLFSLDKR